MITVACVLKSGGDYSPEWVYALKRGLNRHLPEPFRFVCLTDMAGIPPVWAVSLVHGWRGWFSKLELFRPGLFEGPVLYIDLDTLPVGDLTELASYRGPFGMLSDFYQPRMAASGVMAWTPGPHTEAIYHAFTKVTKRPAGRSDYWYAKNAPVPERLQTLYPGQLVSFKAHARKGPPAGARLVCGHGQPRYSDPKAGWAHREWVSLARAAEVDFPTPREVISAARDADWLRAIGGVG